MLVRSSAGFALETAANWDITLKGIEASIVTTSKIQQTNGDVTGLHMKGTTKPVVCIENPWPCVSRCEVDTASLGLDKGSSVKR